MYQAIKHYCKCGKEAVIRYKPTGEWLCIDCVGVKLVIDAFFRHGVETVYLAPMEDGSVDLFVPMVDMLPIKVYWN